VTPVQDFLIDIICSILIASKRFVVATSLANLAFLFFARALAGPAGANATHLIVAFTLVIDALFCVAARLIYEKTLERYKKKFIWFDLFFATLGSLFYYPILANFARGEYFRIGFSGAVLACLLIIFYIASTDNFAETFSHIICKTISAARLTLLGFLVCAAVVLPFALRRRTLRPFLVIAIFWLCTIFFVLFLAALPTKRTKISVPKIFHTVVLKVMMPIFLFVTFVLFLCIIKAAILRDIAIIGGVENFIATILFAFSFFALIMPQYDLKFCKNFTFYGAFGAVFLVMVQFAVLSSKISFSGLTPLLYTMLIENEIVLLLAFSICIKRAGLIRHILPFCAVVIMIMTATHLNLLDMSIRERASRFRQALAGSEMLTDSGEIVPRADVTDDEKSKIVALYTSLLTSKGDRPKIITDRAKKLNSDFFKSETSTRGIEEFFGFYYRAQPKFYEKPIVLSPWDVYEYDL
jgi:hypothetical protein